MYIICPYTVWMEDSDASVLSCFCFFSQSFVEGIQLSAVHSVQQEVDPNRGAGGEPPHIPLKRNSIAAAVTETPVVRTEARSTGVMHTAAEGIPSVGDVVLLMVQTKLPSSPVHDTARRMARHNPLGIFLPCM